MGEKVTFFQTVSLCNDARKVIIKTSGKVVFTPEGFPRGLYNNLPSIIAQGHCLKKSYFLSHGSVSYIWILTTHKDEGFHLKIKITAAKTHLKKKIIIL